ncbi:hypothetical protein VNO77_08260 [Canavalia gladiata]|uniref:Uncharacterized protein n=1 Tax=Canavalia gladiata TaxID=3824 RepID=A0AAN9MF14_CANGL
MHSKQSNEYDEVRLSFGHLVSSLTHHDRVYRKSRMNTIEFIRILEKCKVSALTEIHVGSDPQLSLSGCLSLPLQPLRNLLVPIGCLDNGWSGKREERYMKILAPPGSRVFFRNKNVDVYFDFLSLLEFRSSNMDECLFRESSDPYWYPSQHSFSAKIPSEGEFGYPYEGSV